jgi:putative acetyltransferase
MNIAPGDPLSPEGLALIDGSEQALRQFYTAEESFAYSPQELTAPGVTFYIARNERGLPLGCVASANMSTYVEVKRLFVIPSAQGTGLGRKLMTQLEQDARAAGHQLARLETGDLLVAACTLYKRMGYTRRGPFADYPDVPTSTFMEKPL